MTSRVPGRWDDYPQLPPTLPRLLCISEQNCESQAGQGIPLAQACCYRNVSAQLPAYCSPLATSPAHAPLSVKAVGSTSSLSSPHRGDIGARSRHSSFTDFDQAHSRAWSDGEDELFARARSASNDQASIANPSTAVFGAESGIAAHREAASSVMAAAGHAQPRPLDGAEAETGGHSTAQAEPSLEASPGTAVALQPNVQGVVPRATAATEEALAPTRETIRLAKFTKLLDVPNLDLGAWGWNRLAGPLRESVWDMGI